MMIKNIQNKLKSKQGFSSILFVVLTLLIVEMIAIFQILLFKSYTFNEIQGIMDITGINTLYKTVNTTYFRDEYLAIQDSKGDVEDDESIDNNTEEKAEESNKKVYAMSKEIKQKLTKTYQDELNEWMAHNGDGEIIQDMKVTGIDASIEYSTWGTGAKMKKKSQLMMDGITEVTVNSHLNMDPTGGLVAVPVFSSHNNGTSIYQIQSVVHDSDRGVYIIVVRSMVRLIIEGA